MLEEEIAAIKNEIESSLNGENYKDDYVSISYSKPTERSTIDLKTFQMQEPENYNDLFKDYPKTTLIKGSYRYTFAKEE